MDANLKQQNQLSEPHQLEDTAVQYMSADQKKIQFKQKKIKHKECNLTNFLF